jgi:hypothetical protein
MFIYVTCIHYDASCILKGYLNGNYIGFYLGEKN